MNIAELMTMEVMSIQMWELFVRVAILACGICQFAKFIKRYGSSLKEE